MQDRYAGDIGDYVKFALLRALAPDRKLGVAWYLFPDESHNGDGRHTSYLDNPMVWRSLDPELFDALASVRHRRNVASLEASGVLPGAIFASEPVPSSGVGAASRSLARSEWFSRTLETLQGCNLVFADPDNGLIDDSEHRRRSSKFGKQMPVGEALALAAGREAVLYHHNTRYPGGHDLEVEAWQRQLKCGAIAIRANAFSCRTFFILNPAAETAERAASFAARWSAHRVRLNGPL